MGTRLTIRVPRDYVLARDVCSYGYFGLAPNLWDVKSQALGRVLELDGGPVHVVIGQGGATKRQSDGATKGRGREGTKRTKAGQPLRVLADRALGLFQRNFRKLLHICTRLSLSDSF